MEGRDGEGCERIVFIVCQWKVRTSVCHEIWTKNQAINHGREFIRGFTCARLCQNITFQIRAPATLFNL